MRVVQAHLTEKKLHCLNFLLFLFRPYLQLFNQFHRGGPFIFCFLLFDLIRYVRSTIFSYIGMGLPGLNQS